MKNTKSEPAQTAGNAPEPWMLAAAEELHRVEIGMEDGAVFDAIDQGEISIRARIIAKHYAASSQEAAPPDDTLDEPTPPMSDASVRVINSILAAKGKFYQDVEAEPAPSPATKETPPHPPKYVWACMDCSFATTDEARADQHQRDSDTKGVHCFHRRTLTYNTQKVDVAERAPTKETLEYWKSRATTAELKVLTFYEKIAKPASSQGPAREETPPRKQQALSCIMSRSDITKEKALGLAFDAGAKSVVATPQLEKCKGCQETGMHPSHDGSQFCESGSIASGGDKAHCTCDWCF